MKMQATIQALRGICLTLLILYFTIINATIGKAQTDAINVYSIQNLSFGAFTRGTSGGSVTISSNGIRSVAGSVVPLNFGLQYSPAVFEIEAPLGTFISFFNSSNAILRSSNGGFMSVRLGESDPVFPFNTWVRPPERTRVTIGGTLTVGDVTASPPGSYSGTIDIAINYQ